MAVKKMTLLVYESIYWRGINSDIESSRKNCSPCLYFQQMHSKEKLSHHKILERTLLVVATHIFYLYKKKYLCILDNFSKQPVKMWRVYLQTS